MVALYHGIAKDYISHYNDRAENKENYDYLNCYNSLLLKRVRTWGEGGCTLRYGIFWGHMRICS